MTYTNYIESQKKGVHNGWYLRNDNNGWRPVNLIEKKLVFLSIIR